MNPVRKYWLDNMLRIVTPVLDALSQETKLNFTLLATPAEGLSGRFVEIDRKRFGSIEGVTDREYYTNSFHIPVYYPISAYKKIQLEAPYHALTNAGHITYVELDGDDMALFERLMNLLNECDDVDKIYHNVKNYEGE